MIFGMNLTRLLCWFLGTLMACGSATFGLSDSVRHLRFVSTAWALEKYEHARSLLKTLSQALPQHTKYEETHVSTILSRPIVSQGTLSFTPPSRLEKHVNSPREERYIIDGDSFQWEEVATGKSRELFLPDYPLLQTFVEGFRAVFAGDLHTLKNWFDIEYQGNSDEWRLSLTPINSGIGSYVDAMVFFGKKEKITSIEIQEVGGDYSHIKILAEGK